MMDMTSAKEDLKLKRLKQALARKKARENLNKPIATQVSEWLNEGPKWSIALTLHTPSKLRQVQQGYDEIWLERQVAVLFNILSKVIFPGVPKKDRPMLRRLITLENDANVGWHVHGVISTPKHLDDEVLIEAIQRIWIGLMGPFARKDFRDRLVWCEIIYGNYQQYCMKSAVSSQVERRSGPFGTVSFRNTHL